MQGVFLQVLIGGAIGVASGMRHAIEPDHLAAVSTFAAEDPNAKGAMRFAAAWGFGHAIMLLVVSGVLVATRKEMPVVLVDAFELVVAATLVGLGVRALVRRSRHGHHHGHDHSHRMTLSQPLVVGLVHGLAGSGAITALALSTLGSTFESLTYVALYGFGAMLGMAALAGVAGAPLAKVTRSERAHRTLFLLTGAASLAIGVVWAAQAVGRLL